MLRVKSNYWYVSFILDSTGFGPSYFKYKLIFKNSIGEQNKDPNPRSFPTDGYVIRKLVDENQTSATIPGGYIHHELECECWVEIYTGSNENISVYPLNLYTTNEEAKQNHTIIETPLHYFTSSKNSTGNTITATITDPNVKLWNALWSNYPHNTTAPDIYKSVGGKAWAYHKERPETYRNACALRFSIMFNKSGILLPKNLSDSMILGHDKKYYTMRVSDVIKFSKKVFKDTHNLYTFNASGTSMKKVQKQLKNMKGLIIFEVSGWLAATGHVTLWDGKLGICADSCYFSHNDSAKTTRILFWRIL